MAFRIANRREWHIYGGFPKCVHARFKTAPGMSVLTLIINGSPPITRTTFQTGRAHYPGEFSGADIDCFAPTAFPQLAGGLATALQLSRPARVLLTLRPTGSLGRPSELCREAPAQPVTRPSCSLATEPCDNFPGRIPPLPMVRTFGVHGQYATFGMKKPPLR